MSRRKFSVMNTLRKPPHRIQSDTFPSFDGLQKQPKEEVEAEADLPEAKYLHLFQKQREKRNTLIPVSKFGNIWSMNNQTLNQLQNLQLEVSS